MVPNASTAPSSPSDRSTASRIDGHATPSAPSGSPRATKRATSTAMTTATARATPLMLPGSRRCGQRTRNLGAMEEQYGFRTRAVHAGGSPDPSTGARAVPIYQTTSFVFEDTLEAATLFALQKYGNIYSRIANPTVAAFEERMASLEGGLGAVGTSSGQSAEFLTFAALAVTGDHLVSSARLYGG